MKHKKSRTITVRLSETDYAELEAEATESGLSISQYVREKSIPKFILI